MQWKILTQIKSRDNISYTPQSNTLQALPYIVAPHVHGV